MKMKRYLVRKTNSVSRCLVVNSGSRRRGVVDDMVRSSRHQRCSSRRLLLLLMSLCGNEVKLVLQSCLFLIFHCLRHGFFLLCERGEKVVASMMAVAIQHDLPESMSPGNLENNETTTFVQA